MKLHFKQVLLTCIPVLLCGCNAPNEEQDDFYNRDNWGLIRMPLIKPYVAVTGDDGPNRRWTIGPVHLFATYNIKRVAVQDSIVFLRSGKVDERNDSTIINTINVSKAWFVIDARNQVEKGFDNENEFKQYVEKNNYPLPHWYNLDSLAELLGSKSLPWRAKR
jgi:hypothetical protein